jgi:1-acyl-sn-glycerol-3-phosphate acyltransferase
VTNFPFYWVARAVVKFILKVVWRIRAYGVENIPMSGPLIVACNHISNVDPPALGVMCPRMIRYMAKEELFRIPVLAQIIRACAAYPVDRKGSAAAAIKRSVEVLRKGGAIGIFPEGGRNITGQNEVRQGVALLASLAQAPVVPACIVGTRNLWGFNQIKVVYGEPMRLPPHRKATREDMAKFTDEVMGAIRALAQRFDGN